MSKKFYTEALKWQGHDEQSVQLTKFLNENRSGSFDPAKTSWCARFVTQVLHRCGYKGTNSDLARSYLKWGIPVDIKNAKQGDLVIFKRGILPWQGHIGLFNNWVSSNRINVFGGNQRMPDGLDRACFKTFPVDNKLLGVRREAK
jgi:uncharacterized protein (TIGR02594 family)